jgi:hypothetical protein
VCDLRALGRPALNRNKLPAAVYNDHLYDPVGSLESGPGNSVGIATDYGLDGPRSNPGGNEFFRPYSPTLGPTQPPVKWVLGLSRG